MAKNFLFSVIFLSVTFSLGAYVPECPYFNNKKSCLESVEKGSHKNFEYIREEFQEDSQPELMDAALDIQKYEALACQRTCYN